MGDSVIEEAMMATSLMGEELMDGTYDPYTDMASFSANLCDVVQDDEMGMYSESEDPEGYVNRSKRLMCKTCGKSFKNKILLKKHSAMHNKDLLFECDQCLKRFNRKESVTRHMLVHTGKKFFECQECGRMFNQNGHLRTHMLVHTKEKNFECEKCNMKFARKDNLKRHSMLHDRQKSYECNTCGKRFNQSGHLESHMLVHTQEKNFECQQCSMKFARRDTLKRHMLVHSKEKTYECDYCNARFIQNSHLKAHVLVHTREKKFKCPDCDKKFARKGSLKRHVLVHTGERNFECSECGKTFIQKTHLNKHQLIHNVDNEKPSDDKSSEFVHSTDKVEVHSEQGSTEEGSTAAAPKKNIANKKNNTMKNPSQNSKKSAVPTKGTPESGNNSSGVSKNASSSCKVNEPPPTSSAMQQQHNSQSANGHGAMHNMHQQYSVTTLQNMDPGNGVLKQMVSQVPAASQEQDASRNQPNNILSNSSSVMALALIDHFLTGNEPEDNVAPEPVAKGKNSNQWSQKTQQELLAAQTLSAIGQRSSAGNVSHQSYVQAGYAPPQVVTTSCNMQQMPPQGVLVSGHKPMNIRPPPNTGWVPQEKGIIQPQNIVYNVPPPPAHEIFRYCQPTNVPLPHPSNFMGQFKDGIPRLPEGSCIPADMRASPRKPKYPQKVVVPMGDWQYLPVPVSAANPNMPLYTHGKQPSEIPRMFDKQ